MSINFSFVCGELLTKETRDFNSFNEASEVSLEYSLFGGQHSDDEQWWVY
jgi:hypothetical protein